MRNTTPKNAMTCKKIKITFILTIFFILSPIIEKDISITWTNVKKID